MTSRRASAWLLAAYLALAVGVAATDAPARAQDRCDGVWVVVDATALGAGVTTRCAPGDPATGLEALQGAGHSYTFVPRQPGLVCTIDARPDPCNGAPQDAYWSYWHAPAGGAWTYATRGAGNRDPEPGTAEGWAFGAGDPPRQAPPTAAAQPDPAPAEEPEPAEQPPAEAPERTAAPGTAEESDGTDDHGDDAPAEDAGAAADPATGTVASGEPTFPPLPTPTASPSELDDPPGPVDPRTASPTPGPVAGEVVTGERGGAPVGLIAGGVLIAGIAGAGVLQARRRRG